MLLLLGLAFASLALAVGCATGRKAWAYGVTGVVAVATYMLNVLAPTVSALRGHVRPRPSAGTWNPIRSRRGCTRSTWRSCSASRSSAWPSPLGRSGAATSLRTAQGVVASSQSRSSPGRNGSRSSLSAWNAAKPASESRSMSSSSEYRRTDVVRTSRSSPRVNVHVVSIRACPRDRRGPRVRRRRRPSRSLAGSNLSSSCRQRRCRPESDRRARARRPRPPPARDRRHRRSSRTSPTDRAPRRSCAGRTTCVRMSPRITGSPRRGFAAAPAGTRRAPTTAGPRRRDACRSVRCRTARPDTRRRARGRRARRRERRRRSHRRPPPTRAGRLPGVGVSNISRHHSTGGRLRPVAALSRARSAPPRRTRA